MTPCHEEQFDVVLVARQRLIEQLKDLCKPFQVPSALKTQDPANLLFTRIRSSRAKPLQQRRRSTRLNNSPPTGDVYQ
jgi:hypothetical protein